MTLRHRALAITLGLLVSTAVVATTSQPAAAGSASFIHTGGTTDFYDASSNLVGSIGLSGGSSCSPAGSSLTTTAGSSSGTSTVLSIKRRPSYWLSITWGTITETQEDLITWTHTGPTTFSFSGTSTRTWELTPAATACGAPTGTPCTIAASSITTSGTGTGDPIGLATSDTLSSDSSNSVGDTTVSGTGTACSSLGAIDGGYVDVVDEAIHVEPVTQRWDVTGSSSFTINGNTTGFGGHITTNVCAPNSASSSYLSPEVFGSSITLESGDHYDFSWVDFTVGANTFKVRFVPTSSTTTGTMSTSGSASLSVSLRAEFRNCASTTALCTTNPFTATLSTTSYSGSHPSQLSDNLSLTGTSTVTAPITCNAIIRAVINNQTSLVQLALHRTA